MVNLIMINWNCSIGYLNGMQSSISNNHTFKEVRRKAKIELVVRCWSGWIVDRAGVIITWSVPLLWSEHTQPQPVLPPMVSWTRGVGSEISSCRPVYSLLHTQDEMAQTGHLESLFAFVTQSLKRLVKSENVFIVVYHVRSFPRYQEITVCRL